MKKLAAQFVPVADEVYRLQVSKDPEGVLFNKIAEQGHYGGRTQPTNTRQGIYAFTPSGTFLASGNSNDPAWMRGMLQQALAKWAALKPEERLMPGDPRALSAAVQRPERHYPKDGLVLRSFSRDLPRPNPPKDWRASAWNQDYLWYTKAEMAGFVPTEGSAEVPAPLVRRLVRLNLVDHVRGQTPAFTDKEIQAARLTAQVVRREGSVLVLRYEGASRTESGGKWSISGYRDMNSPSAQSRGIETKMLGHARYDTRTGRFIRFDLLAVGTRWGGTQYNGRGDDLAPAPIGFAFTLGEDKPEQRVAPSNWWGYGWR